jgi:hypothetical protein
MDDTKPFADKHLSPASGRGTGSIELAEQYMQRGSFQIAEEIARDRLHIFPGDMDAKIILGRALIGMGKNEEGAVILETVAADIARWSRVYQILGERYAAQGSAEKSARAYEIFSAISGTGNNRLSPSPPSGKGRPGGIFEAKTDAANAESADRAEAAGEISPDFRTVTLAELCIRQGHLEAAKTMLAEILGRDKGNLKAAERLREVEAMLGKASGKNEEVLRELQRWLRKLEKAKDHGSDAAPPYR